MTTHHKSPRDEVHVYRALYTYQTEERSIRVAADDVRHAMPSYCTSYHPSSPHISQPTPAMRLKGVVLGGNLLGEKLVEDRDLLHDVVADLGHLGEEPKGSETECATDSSSNETPGTTLDGVICCAMSIFARVGTYVALTLWRVKPW